MMTIALLVLLAFAVAGAAIAWWVLMWFVDAYQEYDEECIDE